MSAALRTGVLTITALAAFAANSILCRLALGAGQIDAASFTSVRLLAGAVALVLIAAARSESRARAAADWWAAAALFLYAAAFSLAYVSLEAGAGALILFGAVQLTMILAALARGLRPGPLEWVGLGVALTGLVYLVAPGLSAPPLGPSMLMAGAGVAWGVYSLRGGGAGNVIAATRDNFVRTLPLALALMALWWGRIEISAGGVLLAATSGALTSGAGYAVWYAALRGLDAARAAIVQLAVPVLAAVGSVLWLGERLSWRLAVAAVLILGGVAVALTSRRRA